MKKLIRIGNQTSYSAPGILQPFEYAVSSGFDAFEWFPDKKETGEGWTSRDLSKEMRAHIRAVSHDRDIRLSVHVPWDADPLRPEAYGILLESVTLAEDIGAALVNIHYYNQDGPVRYAEAILPLLQVLKTKGIGLSIENTSLTGPTEVNRLFHELRRRGFIEEFHVGMCLDLGHANLCEETRNDYLKFLDILDPQAPIVHAHLHENYGDADSHLPLFTGPAGKDDSGIRRVLQRMTSRGFSGSIIFEQWPDPPGLLNQARDRLLGMIRDLESEDKTFESRESHGNSLPSETASSEESDSFAVEIAEADRQFHSWRKKLEWVANYLENATRIDAGHLACLAIYFRFMGTGLIRFGEDGGHYRPSHHADIARRIFERLAARTTPENIIIIRKIYPWLPSFDSAFIHAEPLTRIRDIAHRNDIPQELKREIKTTLQNKLHRSAGPEDLIASARLLERISAAGAGYPAEFVAEFGKFHEELKEFFNARSLDEQLRGLQDRGNPALSMSIRKFLSGKESTETPAQQLFSLGALSNLRARLHGELETAKGSAAQELQLADIRLEDYGFVLLSRLVNHFEPLRENLHWEAILSATTLSVTNLRLSGLDGAECSAIESELRAWSRGLDVRDPEQLLRLKATLERAGRLAKAYCNNILSLYPERAQRLGRLLGVEAYAIKVFAEADIRSHPVFQLSKLVAVALKEIRRRASLPLWDVIVPGSVDGRLVKASEADELAGSDNEPIVALLERVDGDEEIRPGVAALIVAQDTPHLSHLAVRARQSGVVFAVCEDPDRFSQLGNLAGKQISLKASPSGIELGESKASRNERSADVKTRVRPFPIIVPEARLLRGSMALPLAEVTASVGGEKAWAARRLHEMAQREDAGFKAPDGMVIPFGVPENLIHSNATAARRYDELLRKLNDLPTENLTETAQELRSIVERLRVPEDILSGLAQRFCANDRLMVRSSSNMEDLEDLPAAGQYESVANVGLPDIAAAVLRVWASLWASRAVRSRQDFGISQEKARMAVLIQRMMTPDPLSFIIHTVNPVNFDRDEAYIEMAVGMGETLASIKSEGTPYRIACRKEKESVRFLAFADFSRALWPDSRGQMVAQPVDYSAIAFSRDRDYRHRLSLRLGRVARFVENAMGKPQDIEGLILQTTVYLVQSRPQQGGI
jgi:phosphoglucan, water dikinase